MPRRTSLVLIGAFLLTRLLGLWWALEPQHYSPTAVEELVKYQEKAVAILEEGGKPYGNVPLEYPPGTLPLILGPQAGADAGVGYGTAFIGILALLDLLGFVGLWRLAARWGSNIGPWLWVAMVPALGPLVYLRLDLLPAVATIWLVERAAAQHWFGSGASLSLGILTKIYPVFFLPVVLWVAPRKKRLALCLGALWVVIPLIGFGDSLDNVIRSVLGYHAERSIHIESTWATPFLLAMRNGYDSTISLTFGAWHVEGGAAPLVKAVATVCSALVAIATIGLAMRRVRTGDIQGLAAAMFMILLATMAVGLVFSPQFMIWLFALGGAVLCAPRSHLRNPILALIPIALLTQLVYPFLYDRLLVLDPLAIFAVATRNVLIAAMALVVTWRVASARSSSPEADKQLQASVQTS